MKIYTISCRVCTPLAAFLSLLLNGCQHTVQPAPHSIVQAPTLPPPTPQPPVSASALSYGMVTGRVQKGVTTQQELLELFGGPSTLTTDRDGTEIWMYDKTTSTVTGSTAQSSAQAGRSEAGVMAAFLGIPLVAGVGGAKTTSSNESAQVSQSASSVTRSVRTITFILKFNADKTVKDYAVRQASY